MGYDFVRKRDLIKFSTKRPQTVKGLRSMDQITARTAPVRPMPNLVIWLKRMVTPEQVGVWVLDRLTVRANGVSHDLSFTTEKQASHQLSADLWTFLRGYLPTQTDDFVLTAREAIFESSAILLHGLDVTAHQIKGGVQRVLLTFRNFLGNVSTIFEYRAYLPHPATRCEIVIGNPVVAFNHCNEFSHTVGQIDFICRYAFDRPPAKLRAG